jgi:hypothetical protein
MSGHTPGPWRIVNGSDVFTPLGAANAAGVHAAHNDGWHIADCGGFYTSTDDGEAALEFSEECANVRLIAAAPDLLEVLQEVLAETADCCDVDISEVWDFAAKARAAIAKATGEAA